MRAVHTHPEIEMSIGGDNPDVPTEIQIRDKLQARAMNRRSEDMEEAIYRDFIESVTVTSDVMAVLVGMPEIASIEEAREYLRHARETSRAAPTGTPSRGGLRSVAARVWRQVVALLSRDELGNPRNRYPGVT
jgi:hypothetical protein